MEMAQHSEDVAARYPAPSVRAGGRPFTIAAFVCAGLGVLFGLLAALAGVVLGIIGPVKGDRPLGAWSIGASVLDRKRGVVGKGWSVRVDPGVRRRIKKKK